MKKLILGVAGILAGWMWSRGHRNPTEWAQKLPQEVGALWDDLDDAFGAGRRANARAQQEFDEDLRRARPGAS